MPRSVLGPLPVFAVETDKRDAIVWMNTFNEAQNGVRLADVAGLKMTDLWAEAGDATDLRERVRRGNTIERLLVPRVTKLGRPVWLDLTMRPLPSGGLMAVAVDCTAAVELAATQSLLQRVIRDPLLALGVPAALLAANISTLYDAMR